MVNPGDTVIILGDFNLSDIAWAQTTDYEHAIVSNHENISSLSERFLNALAFGNMHQYNALPTTERESRDRSNANTHILDLVIANDVSDMKIHVVDNATSSTHDALEITVPMKVERKRETTNRKAFNFKKADWGHMYRLLSLFFISIPNNHNRYS